MLQDRLADKHDELTTCARQGHIEAPRIQDKRLFARHKVALGDHIAGDHEVPFLPLEAVHRIDERGGSIGIPAASTRSLRMVAICARCGVTMPSALAQNARSSDP